MQRLRTQMTTILLGVGLVGSAASALASELRSFSSVSEWSVTFRLVREYQEMLASGAMLSVTDHRWHANGTIAITPPADASPATRTFWSGEGPVAVEVDHEVVTFVMHSGDRGVRSRHVEQGQDLTRGSLALFIDPEGATYDLHVGAEAIDVEVLREDTMLIPGAEQGIPVNNEKRMRNAHDFGASAQDIALPVTGLLLSGSTETEAGVLLEWSIEPAAQ